MSRRPFTDAHPKQIRGLSDLKPAVAGTVARYRAGCAPVVRPFAAASSVAGFSLLLLGIGSVGSRERVCKLSRSLCCRASLAESGCLCALAPRGAPRLPAPVTAPQAIAVLFLSRRRETAAVRGCAGEQLKRKSHELPLACSRTNG